MKNKPINDVKQTILANLPPLPSVLRYYDDFLDVYGEIVDPKYLDRWILRFNGHRATVDFYEFELPIRTIVKSWCAFMLGSLSPATVVHYIFGIKRVERDRILDLLTSGPRDVRSIWRLLHSDNLPYAAWVSLKRLLAFSCRVRLGNWGPQWLDLLSQLPLPKKDKYATVRLGDAFLSIEEESAHAKRFLVPDDLLKETCILVCSYQLAFRAKQIAMLEMRNVRIWQDGFEEHPAVHLTFTMIKQRSPKQRLVDAGATEEELAAFLGHSDLAHPDAGRKASSFAVTRGWQCAARLQGCPCSSGTR